MYIFAGTAGVWTDAKCHEDAVSTT